MSIEKSPCGNCGSILYRTWRMWYEGKEDNRIKMEACSDCKGVKPSYARDASGQKVEWPTGETKYSYAADTVIGSARQLSEHLKKNNANQVG